MHLIKAHLCTIFLAKTCSNQWTSLWMAARSCIAWSENTLESSLQFMGAAMSTSFATKPKSSTPNKNKNNREKLKLIGLGSIFFAATQAFLPIGVPTKGYQFGFHVQIFSILAPLCKYVLAQGAVVARFGRNFTTSFFGFCSSWVQVLAWNSNKYIGISKNMVRISQNLTTSLFGLCSSLM